jgi:hypothetical protein
MTKFPQETNKKLISAKKDGTVAGSSRTTSSPAATCHGILRIDSFYCPNIFNSIAAEEALFGSARE